MPVGVYFFAVGVVRGGVVHCFDVVVPEDLGGGGICVVVVIDEGGMYGIVDGCARSCGECVVE